MANTAKTLKPGKYHEFTAVMDWLYFTSCRTSLASIFKKAARTIEVEGTVFVSAEEAKTFIVPSLYREMECDITTYMVTEK